MYNKKVIDHFMNPRNVGEIKDADGVGEAGNPHGDHMKLFLKIQDDRIIDAKFKTFGCAAAIASSSMATELIKGKTLTEAWELTNEEVTEALEGLPPGKLECSVVSKEAIHNAINEYRRKQGFEAFSEHT